MLSTLLVQIGSILVAVGSVSSALSLIWWLEGSPPIKSILKSFLLSLFGTALIIISIISSLLFVSLLVEVNPFSEAQRAALVETENAEKCLELCKTVKRD